MANLLDQGIVLTLSAASLELRPQPLRLLLRLRQLAGHSRRLVTYTKSLATLFRVTTNTIRNWRNDLVDGGWIHWILNQRTGMVTIMLTELVEPPSRRARLAEERRIEALPRPLPWQQSPQNPRPPEPKPWWKFPMISSFCLGGAKSFAPIKTRQNL